MRVPVSWLKEYVDFEDSPQGLAERLTFSGTEVEGIEVFGATYEGLVVGEIVAVEPHPQADRLRVCAVNAGGAPYAVVCGAPNARVGLKAPFAPPGTRLPNGQQVEVTRIRGVDSHGMLCAEDELGLSEDHSGLMELEAHWAPGTPLGEVLGPPDVVLELAITPNRPDCLCVMGIAREVAALYGSKLRKPPVDFAEVGPPVEDWAQVIVEDPEGCPRYTARVLQNVKIGPSPRWLRRRLELCGIRSINNVVDITNYVMLETGHPLHAFDWELLAERKIIVRRAREGERIVTLDGVERPLTPEMLVIADAREPVALAGVMGGAGSEIRPTTQVVLLESAAFKPALIRRASKRLDLVTESSYRFERGVDPEGAEWASRRAAHLMEKVAGAQICRGVCDAYAGPPPVRRILCRYDRVNALLGLNESGEQMRRIFEALELPVEEADDQQCVVRAPSFRPDLEVEVDLAEEVARILGLDRIPSPAPHARLVPGADDTPWLSLAACRAALVGLGLREIMNYSFLSARLLDLFQVRDEARRVVLPNPVSQDHAILRPALVYQMVETLGRNFSRQIEKAGFFEIGRVFYLNEQGRPCEEERLAVGLMGPVGSTEVNPYRPVSREEMFLWIKGIWSELAKAFRAEWHFSEDADAPYLDAGAAVAICVGDRRVGRLGLIRPEIGEHWRISQPVGIFEVELSPLLGRKSAAAQFRPIPQYPSVRRDVALVVPEPTRHEEVERVIRKAAPPELESAQLFDIFRGGSVPAGRKSLAYALIYRAADRTLTDEEANRYHEAVKEALRRELGAEIREA